MRTRTLPFAIILTAVLLAPARPVGDLGPEYRTVQGSRRWEPSPGPVVAADSGPTHPRRPLPRHPLPSPPTNGKRPASVETPGTARPSRGHLQGTATWYRWRPGEAAAGPALRAFLGPSWRGSVVTVRAGSRAVRVRLTDWCECGAGRIVDLDVRTFSRLVQPSRGILRVEVYP